MDGDILGEGFTATVSDHAPASWEPLAFSLIGGGFIDVGVVLIYLEVDQASGEEGEDEGGESRDPNHPLLRVGVHSGFLSLATGRSPAVPEIGGLASMLKTSRGVMGLS